MSLILSIFAVLMVSAMLKTIFGGRKAREEGFYNLLKNNNADALSLIMVLLLLVFYIWTGLLIGNMIGFIGAIVMSVDLIYSFVSLVKMLDIDEYKPASWLSRLMDFAGVAYLVYFLVTVLSAFH